jgi:hypothetical protein
VIGVIAGLDDLPVPDPDHEDGGDDERLPGGRATPRYSNSPTMTFGSAVWCTVLAAG